MANKLRTYVHVDGVAYGPDDDVPAEVAKQITNPNVWESDEGTAKKSTSRTSKAAEKE